MTVLDVIQKSAEFLTKKGVEAPRLQVELMLAHVLCMPRMKLYLNFDRVLSSAELDSIRECVQRRGNREPLQHIVGTTSFCGVEIKVSPHVLIPRPETETLAELAWKYIATLKTEIPVVLDFATGSGCIALAVAMHCPTAKIHALDISTEALSIARENAAKAALSDRVFFHEGDGFAALPEPMKFHLIISNPPYIPSAEIATLDPEVRDFDPKVALDGGPEGLDFYKRLAGEGAAHLAADGRMMVEFGDGQANAISEIFKGQNWTVHEVVRDLTGRERFLIASQNS